MTLVDLLKDCGALKLGGFTLTSGRKSHYYVDIKKAVTKPRVLRVIVRAMLPYTEGCDRIAGIELGGVPLAVALGMEALLPYVIIRKETRRHGTRSLIEGEVEEGDLILLVEDVVTTGGSVVRGVGVLREAGARVETVVTVVDREEGAADALERLDVRLIPLVRARELLGPAPQ